MAKKSAHQLHLEHLQMLANKGRASKAQLHELHQAHATHTGAKPKPGPSAHELHVAHEKAAAHKAATAHKATAAKKAAAPKLKGAAGTPVAPKKRTGTDINPLDDKDKAFNKAVDKYTHDRNAAIAAEKKYPKDLAAHKAKVAALTKQYQQHYYHIESKGGSAYIAAQAKLKGRALTKTERESALVHFNNTQLQSGLKRQEATEKKHLTGKAEVAEQATRKKAFAAQAAKTGIKEYEAAHPVAKPLTFKELVPKTPPVHLYDRLQTPGQKDAYLALKTEMDKYGLSTLAPAIFNYIQNGFSSDTIQTLLEERPEYIQRFAGNQQRLKAGLRVLSPAEYLATEESYKQMLSSAGLPAGFYDKPSDFANWIGNAVSPKEAQDRVDMAKAAVVNAPTEYKTALTQYYGIKDSDMAAYFLDPKKAEALLQQQSSAAGIGAAAKQAGLTNMPTKAVAEQAVAQGVTGQQAQQSYSKISEFLGNAIHLAGIYHQTYTQETAEKEALLGQGAAQNAREKLGRTEVATFSTKAGAAAQGLGNTSQNR